MYIKVKGRFNIAIISTIVTLVILILVNSGISYMNNKELKEINDKEDAIWIIKSNINLIEAKIFHGVDMGIRAYRTTRNDRLLSPFDYAFNHKDSIFDNIYQHAHLFDISRSGIDRVKDTVEEYMNLTLKMKNLVNKGQYKKFDSLLHLDLGGAYWDTYNAFRTKAFNKIDVINSRMQSTYQQATAQNLLIQLLTVIIGIPLLIVMFIIITTYKRRLQQTLKEVNNKNIALEYYYDLLSHQIRSPICSLQGLINLMHTTESKDDKSEIIDRIKSINDNLDSVTRLTREGIEDIDYYQ